MQPNASRIIFGAAAMVASCLPLPAATAQGSDRTLFSTADDAAKALHKAFKTDSIAELKAIFGATAAEELSSGDLTADRRDRAVLALAMDQAWRWEAAGADRKELVIGDEGWPIPIPLVKAGEGWQFDTAAGKEEILSRRIGRNELKAINLCRTYVLLQKEYASRAHDGKAAGLYAQLLRSTPGKQDGLYWRGGQAPGSAFASLVAQAAADGYGRNRSSGEPLWGYRYRVLTAQGAAAKGGARSYMVEGELKGGFALIAYPAEYGRSGIMSFVVNQDGVVYEADLGAESSTSAAALESFNPAEAWTVVP